MSDGGKKQQTTTQTSSNQPYKASQPLLNQGMKDALNLYKGDGLVKPSTTSTVVPYSQQTMQGMNALESQANQNLGGSGLSGQMQGVIDSGGFTGQQQQAVGQLSPFAQGQQNVDTSGFQNMASGGLGTSADRQNALFGQSATPSYSEQNLANVASGGLLGGGDPYFEDVLNRASEEARFAADRTASGMGRFGSADHYGNMAGDIADIQTRARSDQYNRERQNQMAANQMLDSARMSNLGFGLNAANSASGIEQGNRQMQASGLSNLANTQAGNFGRQMEGISQLFNAGQAGFGNLPQAFQNMTMPADALTTVGGAYEDLATRELNDQLRQEQEQNNLPLANIQALLAAAGGAGGYGTTTTTAQAPGQNNGFSNTMGGLLGAASLGKSLFGGF